MGSYQVDTLNRYSICAIAIKKITWFGKSGDSGYAIGSPLAYSQRRIYQVELGYWWQRKEAVKAWPKTVILETVGRTRTAPIYPYTRHLSSTTPQWEPLSTTCLKYSNPERHYRNRNFNWFPALNTGQQQPNCDKVIIYYHVARFSIAWFAQRLHVSAR